MAKSKFPELKKNPGSKSQFNLVGAVVVNDYTFQMDRTTDKSDWIWNTLNLGVDCGVDGKIYADMNSGYGANRDNVVYVHGKKTDDDGKERDDFSNRYQIAWEDRFKETYLKDIGDLAFVTVGIEKDVKDKTVAKKFLAPYDAVKYLQEHLEDGMVVNIKGNLKYSEYDGKVKSEKEITSIFLSKAEPEQYRATFTQTILCDYDFLGKLDKEANTYGVNAYVIDYVGKHNGKPVKKSFSYNVPYEFKLIKDDADLTKRFINKHFKPRKKNEICEIAVQGRITKNGASTDIAMDDIPEDIQELIDLGVYTQEEILSKTTTGGGKKDIFLIEKPFVKVIKDGDTKRTAVQANNAAWTIDSLLFLSSLDMDEDEEVEDVPAKQETVEDIVDDLDLDDLFGDDED